MGSPVSPKVANIYIAEEEARALASLRGAAPTHWLRRGVLHQVY